VHDENGEAATEGQNAKGGIVRKSKLIDWVDAKCCLWGHSMRRIYVKDQKWPESVWARICDGIPPGDFRDVRALEVHEGEALVIARMTHILTAPQYIVLFVHYVIPLPVKEKIFRLGKSRETYYDTLSRVHQKFASASGQGTLTKSA
jgi:hypothetical protein